MWLGQVGDALLPALGFCLLSMLFPREAWSTVGAQQAFVIGEGGGRDAPSERMALWATLRRFWLCWALDRCRQGMTPSPWLPLLGGEDGEGGRGGLPALTFLSLLGLQLFPGVDKSHGAHETLASP